MAQQKLVYRVEGEQPIHCSSCEQRIQRALTHIPGVLNVQASSDTQLVEVDLDSARAKTEDVKGKLDFMGYHAVEQSI